MDTTAAALFQHCLQLEDNIKKLTEELHLAEDAMGRLNEQLDDANYELNAAHENNWDLMANLDALRDALGSAHIYDTYEQVVEAVKEKLIAQKTAKPKRRKVRQ